jgi:hypothetical protein
MTGIPVQLPYALHMTTTDARALYAAATDAFRSKIRSSFVVLLSNTSFLLFWVPLHIIYKD